MSAPKPKKAIDRLRPSRLQQTQLELTGKDVDVADLYLALNHSDINIEEAVVDVNIQRTIQGASTVEVIVVDRDRVLLRSGRLSSRNDIELDGLYFRLKSVDKRGDDLTLAFEEREISLLRTYNRPIKQSLSTSRQKLTRAEFVLRMIREVKEEKIPFIIPELTKVQPIGKASLLVDSTTRQAARAYGLGKTNDLTVKGQPMTEIQRRNAQAVLDTGASSLVPLKDSVVKKCLVMSMMCVIQESTLINLKPALDPTRAFQADSVGLFQQRRSQGWPATRDIPTDAAEFFKRLRVEVQKNPNEQYWAAIQNVQISGSPTAYSAWRTEAERIVTAYGFIDGSSASFNNQYAAQTSGGDYEFYRGVPPTAKRAAWGKESSWDCIQRLAGEVNWRAFFVSGVFYYISEDDLLKSVPIATIDEDSDGIISIDGNYDEGKKTASLTVQCFMGRWAAPPGSIVQVKNMGPWNGRWIVNDISRSAFSPEGSITLKKKMPRLPEPAGSNLVKSGQSQTWSGTDLSSKPDTSAASPGVPIGNAQILAQKMLLAYDLGRWRDDNGKGVAQMRKVAAGLQLNGAAGAVYMDAGPIRAVLWLINQGYKVGTYAWCEDHFNDGQDGHAGGKAVDISSINGVAINENTEKCRKLTLKIAKLLQTGPLVPRQLICGGYGNHRDLEISNCSLPSSDSFYGATTMQQHTNHIHSGV